MGKKASGQEFIQHDSHLVDHIAEHFNNPDVSDVTLTVGDQVFAAHRLVLATQSKVFHRMLLSENWKESAEKKVTLEESPEGMAAFSDFLKFFYTGKLTLTIANVCGVHTLADKYDVSVLKEDCLGFMKDVLSGVHGDALKAGLEWLQYVDSFVPDMLPTCHNALRTNFFGISINEEHKHAFKKLNSNQIKNIFSITDIKDELVLMSESSLLAFSEEKLLPFVRFPNIDMDKLRELYEHKPHLKQFCNEAYKVHAERSNILGKACKRRRMSERIDDEVMCPCSGNAGYPCPHINPRFYTKPPFSRGLNKMTCRRALEEPVDLSNLSRFSQKMLFSDDRDRNAEWTISAQGNYQDDDYEGDTIFESYVVTPAVCHEGRQFTIAIVALTLSTDPNGGKCWQYRYCIKFTGAVTAADINNIEHEINPKMESVILKSPLRLKGSWEMKDDSGYVVSIILHK